ncbi:hypothetical protein DMC30DRAFT_450055, partial [Rhodotorula diobovata]
RTYRVAHAIAARARPLLPHRAGLFASTTCRISTVPPHGVPSATQPLVVPVEAPHELETVDELREVLLSEDEGRLVVFECFDEDLGAFRPVPNARVLPFEKRASLAQAYPSLAIHHVSLTRPHRLELQRALRFSIAPRWIVCSGGPQPRVLERRHFASEEQCVPSLCDNDRARRAH